MAIVGSVVGHQLGAGEGLGQPVDGCLDGLRRRVGEIVEVGANVIDFYPGQIVSGEGHVVCGRCRNCMAGRRHLCAYTSGIGVDRPGAFAEYLALPMSNVWEHSEGIDLDVAALFDPIACRTPNFSRASM